jgi:acetyltransferase-like isoleucine patch superfamily enzyme
MITFIREIFKNIYIKTYEVMSLAKVQKENITCKFYKGSNITNSEFGKYNIVFNDVLMDNCKIGDHSYIQKRSTIFNAEIGKFCSIASNVSVGPGIHKTDGISTHPVFFLSNTPLVKKYSDKDLFESSRRTIIGHDVWIGEKSVIIDGVEIGTGAIIAAGSVVTKNVDPYAIVGGVPAKILKYRFNENEIVSLLKSEWWNYSEEWLQQNYQAFNNIEPFLNLLK